jgi:hypothetical protein
MWTLLRRWWFIWQHYKQLYHSAIITLALVYLLSRRCDLTSPSLFLVFSDNWLYLSLIPTDSTWVCPWLSLCSNALTQLESDPNCQLMDANWTVSELNCLTTDVTSREVSSSQTDLKTHSWIFRCHETTYLLRRKLLRWFPLPRKWTSDMFPIFRGWLLRGLIIVTYETATRSVAVVF